MRFRPVTGERGSRVLIKLWRQLYGKPQHGRSGRLHSGYRRIHHAASVWIAVACVLSGSIAALLIYAKPSESLEPTTSASSSTASTPSRSTTIA